MPGIALAVLLTTPALVPRTGLAEAQEPDTATARADTLPQEASGEEGVSPGDAFLRAVLIPGWGHASIGSYTRGGFYFAAEAATAWMLVRVRQRQHAAADLLEMRENQVRAELGARDVTDPDSILDALESDPRVADAQGLVDARDQQFEDWLALGIFLVFLSGADAFVSAHLADFPQPVELQARPVGPRTMEFGISFPLGPPLKKRENR